MTAKQESGNIDTMSVGYLISNDEAVAVPMQRQQG